MNKLNKTLFMLGQFLVSCVVIAATSVEVPKKVILNKDFAGFQFDYHARLLRGAVISYQVRLGYDGILHWSGLNLGTSQLECSNMGGSVSLEIDKNKYHDMIIQAFSTMKDTKENQRKIPPNRPDYSYPHLIAEYNDQYHSTVIVDKNRDSYKKFESEMEKVGTWLNRDSKSSRKTLSLKVGRDFKTRIIKVELTNSGNEKFTLNLPNVAARHFALRSGTGDIFQLKYHKQLQKYNYLLKPGNKIQFELLIPKDISPSSGLLIYDNTSHIDTEPDPSKQQNEVQVSLCPIKTDNTRAVIK